MQSQMEHRREGSFFCKLCKKPAGPCSRAVLNQERPLSWRSSAEGVRPMPGCLCQLVSGLTSRRQKDSLTCPDTGETRNFLKYMGSLYGGRSSLAVVGASSHQNLGVTETSLVRTGWGTISVFRQSRILSIVTILQTGERGAARLDDTHLRLSWSRATETQTPSLQVPGLFRCHLSPIKSRRAASGTRCIAYKLLVLDFPDLGTNIVFS